MTFDIQEKTTTKKKWNFFFWKMCFHHLGLEERKYRQEEKYVKPHTQVCCTIVCEIKTEEINETWYRKKWKCTSILYFVTFFIFFIYDYVILWTLFSYFQHSQIIKREKLVFSISISLLQGINKHHFSSFSFLSLSYQN